MRRHIALLVALGLTIAFGPAAYADHDTVDGVHEDQTGGKKKIGDGIIDTPLEIHGLHEQQHGGAGGHMAPVQNNLDVVGRWDAPRTKGSQSGIVTDVWSLGDYAYLGTFAPPCGALGVNVVDISDPTNPKKVRFIPSNPGTRVNDVKVFHFEGLESGFTGDLLLHSNENCGTSQQRVGGISIWDVTNLPKATNLATGVGDTNGGTLARARQVHNIYAWQDGDEAYAVIVDDEELLDVDILEITDPSNPVMVAETGLPDWPGVNVDAFGTDAFLHDVWFDVIGGTPTLLLSYWDAGWIMLDVSDPENPTLIDPPADSDYPNPDPLVQSELGLMLQPEGNGHAAVWDLSQEFILAGDEDQSPFRLDFEVTSGPLAGTKWDAGEFSWTVPVASLPDGTLNGPIVFGGYGCADDRGSIPDPSVLGPLGAGEESIIVFQRGPVNDPNHDHDACFFSEKVESGELAGYDAVIIANHHNGSGGGAQPDAFICGSQGSPVVGTGHGLCIGHRFMHEAFGTTPDYSIPYPVPAPDEPTVGTLGPTIEVLSAFDGTGPFHLLDADTLEEIDAWAPVGNYDPAFATGFGDLTMHNVEPFGEGLAAISWYSFGMRVLDFSGCSSSASDGDFTNQDDPGCVTEAGAYIDANGNNFWGVHVTEDGLILGSDRDSGLWIFEFTG